jgi:hypothetical protein
LWLWLPSFPALQPALLSHGDLPKTGWVFVSVCQQLKEILHLLVVHGAGGRAAAASMARRRCSSNLCLGHGFSRPT